MSENISERESAKPEADQRTASASGEGEQRCPGDFHVGLVQDGRLKLVPAGGGVRFPPRVEEIHVLFADEVEHRIWRVELSTPLEPRRAETGEDTTMVHRLRSEGDSEWNEPWVVEVILEEQPNGWLYPMELRYEGIAQYASIGDAVELGIVNDEEGLLGKLV